MKLAKPFQNIKYQYPVAGCFSAGLFEGYIPGMIIPYRITGFFRGQKLSGIIWNG
jgi:hypothetical protein